MENQKLVIEKPVTVTSWTIIPLVEVSSYSWQGKGGVYFYYARKPLAIVLVSKSEKKAISTGGNDVPMEKILLIAPEIMQVIDSIITS